MSTVFLIGIVAMWGMFLAALMVLSKKANNDNILAFMIPFTAALAVTMYGMVLSKKTNESKTPVTPDLVIECRNGECDTTYVYNF